METRPRNPAAPSGAKALEFVVKPTRSRADVVMGSLGRETEILGDRKSVGKLYTEKIEDLSIWQ
jgi:hypothetical protein